MKNVKLSTVLFVIALAGSASAKLIPSADRLTVYDTYLHVRWLADANLAGTPEGKLIASYSGVTNITPGGSMDYNTALNWLTALNRLHLNRAVGYLGHSNWSLPTTPVLPATDTSCTSYNGSGGGSFGYGCTGSDIGSLFNTSLGIPYPNTAVPIPDKPIGPFHNFQPYLYWSKTSNATTNGFHTFSFNTGWSGSNIDNHYMYVLPMIKGQVLTSNGVAVSYWPAGIGTLQVSADGQLVYDPQMDVTWLADADLAKTQTFGAQCPNYEPPGKPTFFPPGIPCIEADGSMTNTTANNWIAGMNSYNGLNGVGWLGQTKWQLPPDQGGCSGFGCVDSYMGELFYSQLGLSQGTPVVPTHNLAVRPFYNVQPYLYWSCSAPYTNPQCQTPPPAAAFEWSFSFGNGFEGTDLQVNNLYVMVYFPQTPAEAFLEAIIKALRTNPELLAFLKQAEEIIMAHGDAARGSAVTAFINHVNAQRVNALGGAQADELIALAQTLFD